MKAQDCVVLASIPKGDTAIKRHRVPLGQCGTIIEVDKNGPMYKVNFGDIGTYWLAQENLELMDDEPAQKILLDETPLAASVDRDIHNEGVIRARGHLRTLAMLAIDVALEAPLDRPSQPGYYCYINRDTVREIRDVLEAAGIPWKQQKKELKP